MTNEELVEQIQSGVDVKKNMGLLYQQNYRFIYKLALPFIKYADIDDLTQEAYFGLEKAVEGYVFGQDNSFMTYATYHIKASIQRYCYNHGLTKRIPIHTLEQIHKYHRFRKEFFDEFGEYPSDKKIMEHLNISQKRLNGIKQIIHAEYCQSINSIIPGTEDVTLEETIADEYDLENDVTDKIAAKEIKDSIWQAVKELDERSSEIITGQYKNGLTQVQISEMFNVSHQRIQQIQNKAFRELREKTAIQKAADFYGYDSYSAYHYGIGRFENTFTSSVEFLALKRLGLLERTTRKHKCVMK